MVPGLLLDDILDHERVRNGHCKVFGHEIAPDLFSWAKLFCELFRESRLPAFMLINKVLETEKKMLLNEGSAPNG
jgi:hypothetical protein